jgi:hypothetical protein
VDAVYFALDGTLVEFDRSFVATIEDAMAAFDATWPTRSWERSGRRLAGRPAGRTLSTGEYPRLRSVTDCSPGKAFVCHPLTRPHGP